MRGLPSSIAILSQVTPPAALALVVALHGEVDRAARPLHVLHASRLHCKSGCSGCCEDDLTVFDVEAEPIRAHHAALLAHGIPHAIGSCAFLDAAGACRIYAQRPYVCRTQGLPLRWTDAELGAELRDICPLNEAGSPIEALEADACWTLGPVEERLARLQLAAAPTAGRIALRTLFSAK